MHRVVRQVPEPCLRQLVLLHKRAEGVRPRVRGLLEQIDDVLLIFPEAASVPVGIIPPKHYTPKSHI
jgi:hypothetical protein